MFPVVKSEGVRGNDRLKRALLVGQRRAFTLSACGKCKR
jgi:hypothetical protein